MTAPSTSDWSTELRVADFDRLVTAIERWMEDAPAWPPLDRARALWARIGIRLEALRRDADRVLVVGVLGGTGTGKSTLLNALVGHRICRAGDAVRPTTRQPVVLLHPSMEASPVNLDDCQAEIQRLEVSLLEQMVLIDCPDPDTQGPGNSDARNEANGREASPERSRSTNEQNLDMLRRILPHCDVLVYVATAQKYKTQAVTAELLRHAPGRQIVFVQTHAALDADITADWQQQLTMQGFSVPRTFRVDSEAALERVEQHRPLPAEFTALVDFLMSELAGRAGHRILRTNAVDLLAWFVKQAQYDIEATSSAVMKLEEAIVGQRERLLDTVRQHVDDQLRGNQGLWRWRLLREVTLRWSGGPFTAFLRVLGSARSALRFIPARRARSLGTRLVTGGLEVGRSTVDYGHESRDQDHWLATAELGISPGDLDQARSVLAGYANQGEIDIDHFSVVTPPAAIRGLPPTSALGREDDSLLRTGQRLYQQLDLEVTDVIQKRTARRAGRIFHGFLELLFIALPAVLLWRLAKDFFYEHLWMGSTQPLYGFDFLAQSALWVLVWGLVLRGVLIWRLQHDLNRDLAKIVQQLTSDVALGPLFDEYSTPARAVRERIARFSKMAADTDRLSHELEASGVSQLGRLHSNQLDQAARHPTNAHSV